MNLIINQCRGRTLQGQPQYSRVVVVGLEREALMAAKHKVWNWSEVRDPFPPLDSQTLPISWLIFRGRLSDRIRLNLSQVDVIFRYLGQL